MTAIEIDPELRLYTRLALGRGWRLAISIAAWTAGITWLTIDPHVFITFNYSGRGPKPPDPGFLPLALLLLMFAPSRAVARLLDLERGGLLDQTRLCGRPAGRTLLAFLVGSTWPYLLVSALFLITHVRLAGGPASALLGLVVFVAALDVSLVIYGAVPASMIGDSRFITPLVATLAIVSLMTLQQFEWTRRMAFDEPAAQVTVAAILAVLPVGVWLAMRRLERPSQSAVRSGAPGIMEVLSRAIPRGGPPEFNRQLRCAVLSGGTLVTLLVAPALMVIIVGVAPERPADVKTALVNALPYFIMGIGAFATASTARREIESSTADLVRLTPQSPESIVLSWYVALALPFWTATALAVGTLLLVDRRALFFSWWLPALAMMLPAVGLAEALQGRKPGTFLWLPVVMVPFLLPLPRELFPRPPWDLNLRPLVVAFATVGALGIAAGRLRRPAGPALVGAAAVAAVAAFVLSTRLVGRLTFPHVVIGLLAIAASCGAEERAVPTAPWRRVGLLGSAAFVMAVLVSHEAGIFWPASLIGGAGAALGLGYGLLIHEVAWRIPLLSFALRASVLAAIERWLWIEARAGRLGYRRGIGLIVFDVHAIEIAVVGAAFLAAAVFHTRLRRTRRRRGEAVES
jgi:hypothetical protein